MKAFAGSFARDQRRPNPLPPPLATDSQVHLFGDPQRYPPRAGNVYEPPAGANLEAVLAMHRTLGIERGVFVQPSIYASDHRLMLAALERAGPSYRGVALVDDTVADAELASLHASGVRAARFNFRRSLNAVPDGVTFLRTVQRVSELGWHIKIHALVDELREIVPLLRRVRVPIVLDHMASLDLSLGLAHPDARFVLDAVGTEGWWVMLSNGNRFSAGGPPWDDATAFAQALIALAPERMIWGTDWPHIAPIDATPRPDAEVLELLYRYAPDPATLQRILVDNPAALFWRVGLDAIAG